MLVRTVKGLSGRAIHVVMVASALGTVACGGGLQSVGTKEEAKLAEEGDYGELAESGEVSLDLSGINGGDAGLALVSNTVAEKEPKTEDKEAQLPLQTDKSFAVIAKGLYPGTKDEWKSRKKFPATQKEITLPKVPTGKVEIRLELVSITKGILKSGVGTVFVRKGQKAAASITLEAQKGSLVIKVKDADPQCAQVSDDPGVQASVCGSPGEPAKDLDAKVGLPAGMQDASMKCESMLGQDCES